MEQFENHLIQQQEEKEQTQKSSYSTLHQETENQEIRKDNEQKNSLENEAKEKLQKLPNNNADNKDDDNNKMQSDSQETNKESNEKTEEMKEMKENAEEEEEKSEEPELTTDVTHQIMKKLSEGTKRTKTEEKEEISSVIKETLLPQEEETCITVEDEAKEINEEKEEIDEGESATNATTMPETQEEQDANPSDDTFFVATVGKPYVYTSKPEEEKGPSDEELEDSLRKFTKQGELPSPAERKALSSYISKVGIESMISGNYKKAKEYDRLQKKFYAALAQNNANEIIRNKEKVLESQLNNAEAQYKVLSKQWDDKMQEFSAAEQERLDKLGEEQNKKLDDFDVKYEDVDALRDYSKPSVKLLALRQQERALLLNNDFKGAQQAAKEAEALEIIETEKQQQIAEADINQKRQNLTMQLQKEIDVQSQKATDKLKQMAFQKEQETAALNLRIENLKRSLSTLKSSNSIAARIQAKSAMAPVIPVMSPKTQKKIKTFRSETPAKRLQVKPSVIAPPPITNKKKKQSLKALPSFSV